jgi:hypothetical protein
MPSLLDATRAAFADVRAAHPTEQFYVFALFSESGDDLQPTCNTLEGLARTAKSSGESEDELRFFPEEFAYHQHGEEHFEALGPRPAKGGLGSAVRALKALDREGFFGKGRERAKIAVLVLRSDQNNREVVEIAQQLNPPSVALEIAAAFEVPEPTGDPTKLGRDEAYSVDSLALSADGKTLAAAGWFGGSELFVYRLSSRPRAVPVKKPRDAFHRIALGKDGTCLFGATRTAVHRVSIGGAPRPLSIASGSEASLAVSPDGETLATSNEEALRLWSAASGEPRAVKASRGLVPFSFTPDGRAIVGRSKGDLVVLDARSLERRAAIRVGDRGSCIAVSNDRVAVGSYDPEAPIRRRPRARLGREEEEAPLRCARATGSDERCALLARWTRGRRGA